MKDAMLVASGVADVSKERDNSSIAFDQSTEAAEGVKDTAQVVFDNQTGFVLPMVNLPVGLGLPSSCSIDQHESKMPSGSRKRRSAKRKQEQAKAQTKRTDEFTSVSVVKVSIPIDKLAKGADMHEAKNAVGQISDESKVTFIDENAVQEHKEVPLLEVTSNKDNAVPEYEPHVESGETLEGNESCGMVCNDSTKETGLFTGAPEQVVEQVHDHDLLPDAMTLKEMSDRDANGVEVRPSNEGPSGFKVYGGVQGASDVFVDAPGVENVVKSDVHLMKPFEDSVVSKDDKVVSQSAGFIKGTVGAGENGAPVDAKGAALLLSVSVTSNDSIKESDSTKLTGLFSAVVPPEEMKDAMLVASVVADVSKEIENSSIAYAQSTEAAAGMDGTMLVASGVPSVSEEGENSLVAFDQSTQAADEMKDNVLVASGLAVVRSERMNSLMAYGQSSGAAEGVKDTPQVVSGSQTGFMVPVVDLPVVLGPPSGSTDHRAIENAPSADISVCSSANSLEVQPISSSTVSPAADSQVYVACPMHCSAECIFPQCLGGLSDVEFTAREGRFEILKSGVVELRGAILSLQVEIQKALEKLDAMSCQARI